LYEDAVCQVAVLAWPSKHVVLHDLADCNRRAGCYFSAFS
jgi:hypothetical protein